MKHFRKFALVLSIVFITQNIFGQGWSVNPADYSNTGEVDAIVLHGTTEVTTGTLGAFVGATCRGYVTGAFFPPTGKTVFTLICYSNTVGETLTFKYYDPGTTTTYDIGETEIFDINMQLGNAMSPIQFHTVPLVFAVTGGGVSYCQGGSGSPVGLNGSELGVTYTLIRNTVPTSTTFAGTGSSFNFPNQLAGTYTVRGNNSGGTTTMSGSASITENPLPSVGLTVGGTGTICTGTGTNITVAGSESGTSYQLRNNAGNINVGSAVVGTGGLINLPTGNLTSTTTFNVYATNSCGSAQLTQTEVVTVNGLPSVGLTVGGTGTICTGTSTNITVAGSESGTSYQLRNNAGNINIGSAVAGTGGLINLPTGNLTTTTTFNVYATNSCGSAQLTQTEVVSISPLPSVGLTVGGTGTICTGTGTNITVAGSESGTSYQLRNNAGNINVGSAVAGTGGLINLPTGNLTTTTTFNVYATNSCGSVQLTQTEVITISPLPAIGLTVGGTGTICTGTGTNITVAGSESATSYQLRNNAGNINVGSAVAGTGGLINLPTGNLTTTTTFNVYATNSCGSAQLTQTEVVTVNGLPSVGLTVGGTGTICTGTGTNITVAGSESGTSYQLRNNVGNINVGSAVAGTGGLINLPTGNLITTTTFNVYATNSCGSAQLSQTAIVSVSAVLVPTVVGTNSSCAGSSGNIYTTESGQNTYVWTVSAGGTITGGGTSTSNTVTVTWNTAGSQSISVRYTSSGGCVSSITNYPVTVNVLPSAPTLGTITQPSCAVATGSVQLSGLPAGNWTINPGAIAGSTSSYTITNLPTGTYNYTVTNASGCISPASGNVVINAQPPTPVVNNLTASILSGGIFTVTPSGGTIPVGTTYTWPVPTYTGGVTGGVAQLTPLLNITGTLTIPSGVGTAIYTVTPTSGTCVGATFTVTVTVTSTCTAVLVGTQPANSSMCAGAGPVTFTVTATGTAPFTYQWQYNNGVTWGSVANGTPVGAAYTNATTSVLSVTGISTAGSYQYRCLVTNCSGGNSIFSNPATLTVNALPIPTLSSSDPDNVFCFGTSVIFTAGGGTNYNFRVNATTVQNGALTTYTTTTLANGQIVTVIVTGADGCTATSAQIQNIVNPLPFIILSTAPACSADFLTYSLGVTVGSGTVTCPSGTVTNMGGNIWTITAIPAHTNVTVRVTDSGGCENTLNVTAPDCNCPVIPAPVSSGNRSYCAGGIIPVLSVTVPAGGNPKTVDWYNSASGGTILLSGNLSYTPSAAGTYYAVTREISSSCVSSTRTPVILTMNPLPVPTLASSDADNIFCGGTSVIFTAGGGTSYNFLVGGLSRQDGASATYTTSTLTNGQPVVVIVTNANGCSATSASITNTVNPTPIPTLTSSDADNSFCTGTNITFTAGGGTNYNFRVEGVSVQNAALTTYSTNSLTNGQVVDVVVSNTYGCTATSTGITNSVFTAPAANAGTGGNNCGLGFSLNGSLNVGIGTWSKVSGPGSVSFSPDANTPTAIVTVSSFGTYVFSWTVANGTCITSANVTVIFIQQPPAEAGPGGDECDKDFIMKAVITTGVGTWTKISGPGTPVFTPDNHQANAKVTVDQFGTYNFGWTVVNSICTSSDGVIVTFHDLPPINAGRDTAFCKGGSMQLHAQGAGTVSWDPPELVSNPSIINPVATPNTTTTFTVNLTDQFGCKNSDNIVVEVREKPVANAGPDQELTYVLKTTMDATLAHSYETGVWSVVPKSTTVEFADSTYSKTLVDNLSLGKNKLLWTVKNGYCPLSSDTVMITVNSFIIPTLITPNMDGRNDYFVLRGLATLGKTELIIFDRRGTQVYRNTNYDNSWNGVDYNKNPLPSDTYFYVLKSQNGISNSGYIVIRR